MLRSKKAKATQTLDRVRVAFANYETVRNQREQLEQQPHISLLFAIFSNILTLPSATLWRVSKALGKTRFTAW